MSSSTNAAMSNKKSGGSGDSTSNNGTTSRKSQQEVLETFNEMRTAQHSLVSKISELQSDEREHDMVISTLKDLDKGRKCWRMIGGVLVERTVGEVLPALQHNRSQIRKMVESLEKQLETKGRELMEYAQKNNIKLRSMPDVIAQSMQQQQQKSPGGDGSGDSKADDGDDEKSKKSSSEKMTVD